MKKFRIGILTVSIVAILFFIIHEVKNPEVSEEEIFESKYGNEYSLLIRKLEFIRKNSYQFKILSKHIEDIKRKVSRDSEEDEEEIKADRPDEFARILSEMRIPYGETEQAYPVNYKIAELKKSSLK